MTVDSARRECERKRDAIAKLQKDRSRVLSNLAAEQKKETDALAAMARTKNESVKKTKRRTADSARLKQVRFQKELAQIDTKISKATKEANGAQKKLDSKIKRANEKWEKSLFEESRKIAAMQQCIQVSERRQDSLEWRVADLEKYPDQITVLYLAASPTDANRLRIDEEAREIRESIARSTHRDSIQLETRAAVRPIDLFTAINETHPVIVHFSGHGADNGDLAFEDDGGYTKFISKEQMAVALATAADHIRLLVFNACFSEVQAKAVAGVVGAAIGMKEPVDDTAAVIFASQLYSSIGFGLSLEQSFSQAKMRLSMDGYPDSENPQLYVADGVDASQLRFVADN